ncbi:MAG: AAA family ATPase [Rhodospirillales bacterium]|jgi:predicted kinase
MGKPGPRLIAFGGLSGSGKSCVAQRFLNLMNQSSEAELLRSDVLRKQLLGCDPLERLDADGYSWEATKATFGALYQQSEVILLKGKSVIADAVFANEQQRSEIKNVAAKVGVQFQGVWLEAELKTRLHRVDRRVGDASDADSEIVRLQESYNLGTIIWPKINASGTKNSTFNSASALLKI